MRILFATAHKYLPQMHGGMQSSVHQLCGGLQQRGHRVAVLAGLMPGGLFGLKARIAMQINARLFRCKVARSGRLGYPVWYTWHPWDAVACVARKHRPDLIVITAHLPVRMALAARATGIPVLMVLQDVEFQKHGGAFEELGQVACVANSRFTMSKYRSAYGVTPSVVYPFIAPEKYRTTTARRNVTLINPHPRKGRDIALEIARHCPDIPFAFVESWPLSPDEWRELDDKLAPLPNVTFVPPQKDMRKVYAECKILLAPSVWEEAYGRVATEAQISGIPVVASARGGLPEAVGPGGVLLDPDQPIADWVAAVRKLWSDQDYYSALSAAATAHAARPEISFEHQVDAFERAMLDAAGYTSPAGREIAALEAEGFRLHHREGDEYHFVEETRPPAETRRP